MASDQTNIVVDACIQVSNQSMQILDALLELEKINAEITALGIDISSYVTAIEGNEATKHCDVGTFKNIISSFSVSLVTAIKGLYDGAPTQQCWTALQKARRIS